MTHSPSSRGAVFLGEAVWKGGTLCLACRERALGIRAGSILIVVLLLQGSA